MAKTMKIRPELEITLFSKDKLTSTPELLEQVLHFLPLSGILARWGIKWNESSERKIIQLKSGKMY